MRPPLQGIVETAIYCTDLAFAIEFYDRVFGFAKLSEGPRVCAYDVGPGSVLLLFQQGASQNDMDFGAQGSIPGHDGDGPTHFAFAIDGDAYEPWRAWLIELDVPIASEMTWDRGGRSVYFHDPDGHVVELATPGVWASY